jgi:hypothetical protein
VTAPDQARTLVEALEWHVARHPDRAHLTLLEVEMPSWRRRRAVSRRG